LCLHAQTLYGWFWYQDLQLMFPLDLSPQCSPHQSHGIAILEILWMDFVLCLGYQTSRQSDVQITFE
jgi:hypothetical protein